MQEDCNTEATAMQNMMAVLYDEMRTLARGALKHVARGQTLDTTALVHEAYLKLADRDPMCFGEPRQFFAYAGQAMRHILVDHARARARLKSGGDRVRITLTESGLDGLAVDPGLTIALDRALDDLACDDPRAAQVVELHYFAGLPMERVASILGVTRRTVDRDWRYARAFLAAQLE